MSALPLFDLGPNAAADSQAALRLSLVSGVGPRIYKALLERFGTPESVLAASLQELRETPGVGAKLSREIAAAHQIDVQAELALCREHQVTVLAAADSGYPSQLREIFDPPQILYVRGNLLPQDSLSIAVVGSRHATRYGLDQARRLASSLARAGLTVISGLVQRHSLILG